jgi:hypothetical protein
MNQDKLGLHLKAVVMPDSNGRPGFGIRSVGVSRMRVWLLDGLCAAREQPLVWLATVLVSADLATVLERFASFDILTSLLVPVLTGAAMLALGRGHGAERQTFREMFDRIASYRGALFTVALGIAAILSVGTLLSSALGHVTLMPWTRADGAHQLAIVFGERCDSANTVGPAVNNIALAVAMAAVWFAPAFVVLHRFAPLDALATSLRAVLHNWPVALCFAVLMTADILMAPLVPTIFRALVVTPLISALILLSMRGSYRDIVGR